MYVCLESFLCTQLDDLKSLISFKMKTKKAIPQFGQTINVPIEIIPLLINVFVIGCSIAYSKGVNSR